MSQTTESPVREEPVEPPTNTGGGGSGSVPEEAFDPYDEGVAIDPPTTTGGGG